MPDYHMWRKLPSIAMCSARAANKFARASLAMRLRGAAQRERRPPMRTCAVILLSCLGVHGAAQGTQPFPQGGFVAFKATRLSTLTAALAAEEAATRAGKVLKHYADPYGSFDNTGREFKWRYVYRSVDPWPKDCFRVVVDDATGHAELGSCGKNDSGLTARSADRDPLSAR